MEAITKEITSQKELEKILDERGLRNYKEMKDQIDFKVVTNKKINNGKPFALHSGEELYHEFVTNCRKAKNRSGNHASENNSKEFTGTKNIDEAYYLAENGWDYGLQELKVESETFVAGSTQFNSSMVGSMVNIPNYINGVPEQMFEIVDEREYDLPLVTVYVRLAYLANIRTNQALEHCSTLVDWINKLQSKNNVRIIGIMDNVWSNYQLGGNKPVRNYTFIEILIKDFDERFVLNNIAFSFHPSFFRRLGFKRYEEIYGLESGYGRDPSLNEIETLVMGKYQRGTTYLVENCTTTRGKLDLENPNHVKILKK